MKCIEATKTGTHTLLGEVRRVDNEDAESKVRSGYWKFIPKSEYKKTIKPEPTVEIVTEKKPQKKNREKRS